MQAKQRNSNKPNRMHVITASMKSTRNKSANALRRRHACFCHVFPVGCSVYNSLLLFGVVIVAFNYCVNDTQAFNLENRLPIFKYGVADTYFGYSVAGHEIGSNDDDDPVEKW